jgi:hypothetical protein
LSYGHTGPIDASTAHFSVAPGAFVAGPGDVALEAAFGEASSDIFVSPIGSGFNTQVYDGDGLPIALPPAPGLGLLEPVSNVDALDLRPGPELDIFYSVDGALLGPAASADIFMSPAIPGYAGFLGFYAPAPLLGLSFGDDIDALVVHEDGVPGYSPATDVIYFSLAAGSPTLAFLGATEGDILVAGGGGPTSVYAPFFSIGLTPGDDLNALDFVAIPEPASLGLIALCAGGLYFKRRFFTV